MSGFDNTSYTTRVVTTTGITVTNQDSVIIATNTAAKAAALLGAALVQPGRQYTFVNAATGAITITPSAGQIDGAATKVLVAGTAAAPTCLTIISDGTMWRSMSATPA